MSNTSETQTKTDQILMLERGALDRWGKGDPGGFLELYADDITYFDPVTAARLDGHTAMVNYYGPFTGKIQIARYEMLNPQVVIDGNLALLTYNLVNYVQDDQGVESVGSCWNSTTIYQRRAETWKTIHSHWSFTRHPAFQNMSPEASERQEEVVNQKELSTTFSQPALETHMTKPEISGIAPFFIVKNVPAALSFYRDRLGFDITFQGPDPDDIFFGIVRRGAAMIWLKDIGVDPVPNYTRDVKKGWAPWDAYLHVPDPDALAAEFSSRNVEFSQPLKDDGDDGLRGFALKDADGYVLFFGCLRS